LIQFTWYTVGVAAVDTVHLIQLVQQLFKKITCDSWGMQLLIP
jgi:hypothetical protein